MATYVLHLQCRLHGHTAAHMNAPNDPECYTPVTADACTQSGGHAARIPRSIYRKARRRRLCCRLQPHGNYAPGSRAIKASAHAWPQLMHHGSSRTTAVRAWLTWSRLRTPPCHGRPAISWRSPPARAMCAGGRSYVGGGHDDVHVFL